MVMMMMMMTGFSGYVRMHFGSIAVDNGEGC